MVAKNKIATSGFSLTELMVGSVILTLAIVFGLKVFGVAFKTQTDAQKRVAAASDSNLFVGHLQKNMATGDVRFFTFSGRGPLGAAATSDRTLMRALFPMVGKCADLTDCDNSTAIVYVDYNKTTAPAVSAICSDVSVVGSGYVVVDLGAASFGTSIFNPSTDFQVTAGAAGFALGKIPLVVNSTLALFSPPLATIWQTRGATSKITGTYDGGTGEPLFDGAALPPGCKENLRSTGPTTYDMAALYKVPIKPWIAQDTNPAAGSVSAAEMQSSIGSFPMRLFEAKVRTVGKLPKPAGGIPNDGILALLKCSVGNDGRITCPSASPLLAMENVFSVELEMAFALSLFTGGTQAAPTGGGVTRFHLKKAGVTPLLPCLPSTVCLEFGDWPLPGNPVPVVVTSPFTGDPGREATDKLNGNTYSQLKIEVLKRLQFSMFDGENKETSFNVLF